MADDRIWNWTGITAGNQIDWRRQGSHGHGHGYYHANLARDTNAYPNPDAYPEHDANGHTRESVCDDRIADAHTHKPGKR